MTMQKIMDAAWNAEMRRFWGPELSDAIATDIADRVGTNILREVVTQVGVVEQLGEAVERLRKAVDRQYQSRVDEVAATHCLGTEHENDAMCCGGGSIGYSAIGCPGYCADCQLQAEHQLGLIEERELLSREYHDYRDDYPQIEREAQERRGG